MTSAERSSGIGSVSRETRDMLERYVDTLQRWQGTHNLIAASTIPHIWQRHVADSLRLWSVVAPCWNSGGLADLGSGAGFPGLVLAIQAKAVPQESRGSVHLVESNSKKAAFLRHVARSLDLDAVIHSSRAETIVAALAAQGIDVVTARALASVKDLLALAEPMLIAGATGIFPKGAAFDLEVAEARGYWSFDMLVERPAGDAWSEISSQQQGPVLIIRNVSGKARPLA